MDLEYSTELSFLSPADAATWVARLEAACVFLETYPALPRFPLQQIALKGEAKVVKDRGKLFASSLKDEYRSLAILNGRRRRIKRGGEVVDNGTVVMRRHNQLLPQAFGFTVSTPRLTPEARKDVLIGVGDALHAVSGFTMPRGAWHLLHERASEWHRVATDRPESTRMTDFRNLLAREKLELPVVQTNYGAFASPFQPELLGWMNYWSEATCQYIGFPQSERDSDLLASATRTPGGAWEVTITPDPLDLMRADHLMRYAELHARFPPLGVKELPDWAQKKPSVAVDPPRPAQPPEAPLLTQWDGSSPAFLIARTIGSLSDVEDVFDLDIDESMDAQACKQLVARIFPGIAWTGREGAASIGNCSFSFEVVEPLILVTCLADEVTAGVVKEMAKRAHQHGALVMDQSADLLHRSMDVEDL